MLSAVPSAVPSSRLCAVKAMIRTAGDLGSVEARDLGIGDRVGVPYRGPIEGIVASGSSAPGLRKSHPRHREGTRCRRQCRCPASRRESDPCIADRRPIEGIVTRAAGHRDPTGRAARALQVVPVLSGAAAQTLDGELPARDLRCRKAGNARGIERSRGDLVGIEVRYLARRQGTGVARARPVVDERRHVLRRRRRALGAHPVPVAPRPAAEHVDDVRVPVLAQIAEVHRAQVAVRSDEHDRAGVHPVVRSTHRQAVGALRHEVQRADEVDGEDTGRRRCSVALAVNVQRVREVVDGRGVRCTTRNRAGPRSGR